MHAAIQPPSGLLGFRQTPAAGLELWFRAPAGASPEVLQIEMRGKRHPRVEAFWDGCLFALNA